MSGSRSHRRGSIYQMQDSRIVRSLVILFIALGWVFSGWPQIGNFPPKVQRAEASVGYVGTAEASGNSASYNVTLPATQEGDLVIVSTGFVSTSNLNPGVSTAGYTEVADLYQNDTRDANFSVSWKIMGSTPDTSVTCLGSGSSTNGAVCVVHVWRGANQATPLDVISTTVTSGNGSNPNSPSITPVTSGAIVISTGLGTMASVDNAVTAPTGYGNQADISIDPGNAATVGISSKAWTSGAEDPAAWTNFTTTTSDSWAAVTLAIRPATVPDAPVIGTATPGDAQASVTFTPPANDGGSTITGYTVTSSPGSFTGTGSGSPIIVTGLSNGTGYTFTVHATNAIGNSSESSASNSVTPPGVVAPTVPLIAPVSFVAVKFDALVTRATTVSLNRSTTSPLLLSIIHSARPSMR